MLEVKNIREFNEIITHEKVLVYFYATWNSSSLAMNEVLEDLKEELKEFEIVKVNMDRFLQLTRIYHITSVPDIKIFIKGKVAKDILGIKTKDELLNILKDD